MKCTFQPWKLKCSQPQNIMHILRHMIMSIQNTSTHRYGISCLDWRTNGNVLEKLNNIENINPQYFHAIKKVDEVFIMFNNILHHLSPIVSLSGRFHVEVGIFFIINNIFPKLSSSLPSSSLGKLHFMKRGY